MKSVWLTLMSICGLLGLVACSGAPLPTFAIGQRVEVKDYPDIVVDNFLRTTNVDLVSESGLTHELEPGNELYVVTLRVINDTDKPAGISDLYDLSILSRGENIDDALSFWIIVRDALEADMLPPGGEATGLVVWEAKQGFDNLALQYQPGMEQAIEKLFEERSSALYAGVDPPAGRYVVHLEPN